MEQGVTSYALLGSCYTNSNLILCMLYTPTWSAKKLRKKYVMDMTKKAKELRFVRLDHYFTYTKLE